MRIPLFVRYVPLVLALLAPGPAAAADMNLAVGSSIVGGTIHIMGTALARVISERVPGVYATAQNTSGPQASLQMIETGEMKIGIVSNPILYEAMEGKATWTMDRKFEQFRTIAVLYSSQFQWFAIKPELKYVSDLNGRILNVSTPGSTSDQVGSLINSIIGVTLRSKNHAITATGCEMLRDGRLDAVCVSQGYPAPSFTDLQITTNGRLLQLTPEQVDKIVTEAPFLSKFAIPANTYKNQPEPLNTVALWNVIVVSRDMPDDVVYAITKAVVENKEAFAAAAAVGKDFKGENIQFAVGPIHPGAARYYREAGIALPEEK
jgi:TRAP transporter TAXI family solute receptor